ncbi:MAG: efflux RND transporter periplasmic adaptor subunit [Gemmataceae bacterium]
MPTSDQRPLTSPGTAGASDEVIAVSAAPRTATSAPRGATRHWWLWLIGGVVLLGALAAGVPWLLQSLRTVSTDDAYVNGHVTFVASRVAGQVARVLVDDNNRVRKGDLLVQLDKEPYQVQVDIAQAAVTSAEADVVTAQAQVRGIQGQMRSGRWNLERAIEDVHNQTALLRSKVATWRSQQASLAKAQADYARAKPLVGGGGVSKEEFDLRKEALAVAQARTEEALQGVYQVRVALGLPTRPETGDDLTQVPENLDQTFSTVRQAQANLIQAAAAVGVTQSFNQTPKEMIAEFYKRDPKGDIDVIYAGLLKGAPAVKQAEAKLDQAKRNLDQARINLRYCDVVAEIDGVVTRRSVNPGNNVTAGQSLMAVRSLTEIWVDANFKETQLRNLRIGQAVDLDVDMYGSRQRFKGRISGFTMGTGSTLALLPAENATGNFVKVVQRLPVRIELLDYDPDQTPLFIGLSVTPSVHVAEPATGPDAGKLLQPNMPTTRPENRP